MSLINTTFFDKLTKIDDLLAALIKLQTQTYNAQVLNNRLLTDLLNKPMVIDAPQLTTITNEQTLNMPSNVDVSPQLYYNLNDNKYYRLTGTYYLHQKRKILAGKSYTGGEVDYIAILKTQLKISMDMAFIANYAIVAYNILDVATNLLDDVAFDIKKNQKIFLKGFYKDEKENYETDLNDDSYYFTKEDKLHETIQNNSARTIMTFAITKIAKYNEITESSFRDYLMRARKFI